MPHTYTNSTYLWCNKCCIFVVKNDDNGGCSCRVKVDDDFKNFLKNKKNNKKSKTNKHNSHKKSLTRTKITNNKKLNEIKQTSVDKLNFKKKK